ncbi:S1/P1 nuclease [Bradyrhizobium iriomotense]|uniref:S1/P1 nuclease n=1 Tax=Bradyrhizobium iriomotense TaxID=441950 RepID=UPI0024E0F1DF|nr:S1/P1 nuclease [Bradyrhizobium iriomotense]
MRRAVSIGLAAMVLGIAASPARAWWDEGHMQIAYLAYKRLSDPVRDKADSLLKLNKDYAKWTAGAADDKTAKMHAFVHAATWSDDIKIRATRPPARRPARTSAIRTTTNMPTGILRTSTSHPTARPCPPRIRSTSSRSSS